MNDQKTHENAKSKNTYLLTWYGITDLRAALGLETAGGPVLGALKTGAFTDAVVLAYTDPSKVGKATDEKQAEWKSWLGVTPEKR